MQRVWCVVAAAALSACGRGTPSAAADTTASVAPAAAAVAPAPPTGELASSRTFNSLLGDFQFAVPDVWEQRYTATERVNPPEYPKAKTVTEFLFLPLSGGTPPALLTIIQYSAKDWASLNAGSGKPEGSVVAEGGGRVFVALLLPSNPFPAGSEDGAAITPMLLNVEQVSKALRIE
jgi:hypothetical protein